jgi:hypothetical protein
VPVFGIVAEGITDQVVLENILLGYFGDDEEETIVERVQPLNDATAKRSAPPPGGWNQVFKFFQAGEHRRALQFYDYLVVQVDTDVSEQVGYDVPHREGGRELTVPELVSRVAMKIKGLIGDEFLAQHGSKLLFAIAVDGIECWLLPLLYNDNRVEKTTGCLNAANQALHRLNREPLSKADHKDYRAYDATSRAYSKRRKLMEEGRKNPSLALFLQNLESMSAIK